MAAGATEHYNTKGQKIKNVQNANVATSAATNLQRISEQKFNKIQEEQIGIGGGTTKGMEEVPQAH